MMQEIRRSSYMGVSIGVLFIALAIAILLGVIINDWILFIPILLIIMGIYGIAIGLISRSRGEIGGYGGMSDAAYFIFWSCIFAMIGSFWLINDVLPGVTIYLILVLLIWFGAAIIFLSMGRQRKR